MQLKVGLRKSIDPDSFARFSPGAISEIQKQGLDPTSCIVRLTAKDGTKRFYWVAPEAFKSPHGPASLHILGVPDPENYAEDQQLHDARIFLRKHYSQASKVLLKPVTLNDQKLVNHYSKVLQESLILQQIRLVYRDAVFKINVTANLLSTSAISLKVKSLDPVFDEVALLGKDTELYIEQSHAEPSEKAPKAPKKVQFTLVINDTVAPGMAVMNIKDLFDHRWTVVDKKIFLTVESVSPIKTLNRTSASKIGLIVSKGSSRLADEGEIHVCSFAAQGILLNMSTVYVSSIDPSTLAAETAVRLPWSLLNDAKRMKQFNCKDSYVVPAHLAPGHWSEEVFIRFNVTTKPEPVTDPKRPADSFGVQMNSYEACKSLMEQYEEGLIVIEGPSEAGKTTICRKLVTEQQCNYFDFEPTRNNLVNAEKYLNNIIEDIKNVVDADSPILLDHVDWFYAKKDEYGAEERWSLRQFQYWFGEMLKILNRIVVICTTSSKRLFQRTSSLKPRLLRVIPINRPKIPDTPDAFISSSYIQWGEFVGQDDAKAALEKAVVWPIKWPKLYQANNMPQFAGVLLHGPPGSGKTALMNSLITNLKGVHVIKVRGPELIRKYHGESEEGVRKVFEEARANRPCLICFDEIDSLAPRRGEDLTGTLDRVVNQLLTEIDGTGDKNGLYIVATTSRKEMMDPALIRSGRIDTHVQLQPLSSDSRRTIIARALKLDEDHQKLSELVRLSEGHSPAQIQGILADMPPKTDDDVLEQLVEKVRDLKPHQFHHNTFKPAKAKLKVSLR